MEEQAERGSTSKEVLLATGMVARSVYLRQRRYSFRYIALCALEMLFLGALAVRVMLLRKKRDAEGTRI